MRRFSTLQSRSIPGVAVAAVAAVVLLTGCPPNGSPPDQTVPNVAAAVEEQFAGQLAITIDDLPWIGAVHPGETKLDATDRLLAALAAHRASAAAFVNCDRTRPDAPLLQRWLDAGHRVDNHSAAHADLNRAPLEQWLRDVRSCHEFVQALTGRDTIFFRYPYLHYGPTRERWEAARELLAELESPIAHVTIDNSDWLLAAAYGEAIRAGDHALQAEIAEAFIEHILRATRHYQEVARRKLGRDVAHILLLHANTLVADHLDTLLLRLREEGFHFVPLEEAKRDPVYERRDEYIGAAGLSWLYRIEPATPEDAAWDDAETARLRERFRR